MLPQLQDKVKGMFIAGAQQVEVKSEDELLQVIQVGCRMATCILQILVSKTLATFQVI